MRRAISPGTIRRVRKANRMLQADLAEHMHVSISTVKRWEKHGVRRNTWSFDLFRWRALEQPELPL